MFNTSDRIFYFLRADRICELNCFSAVSTDCSKNTSHRGSQWLIWNNSRNYMDLFVPPGLRNSLALMPNAKACREISLISTRVTSKTVLHKNTPLPFSKDKSWLTKYELIPSNKLHESALNCNSSWNWSCNYGVQALQAKLYNKCSLPGTDRSANLLRKLNIMVLLWAWLSIYVYT